MPVRTTSAGAVGLARRQWQRHAESPMFGRRSADACRVIVRRLRGPARRARTNRPKLGFAAVDGQRLTGAIVLPDGTVVRGRARRQALPPGPLPTYGLYLGSPGARPLLSRAPAWRPDWPADWVDWPDFRTPRDDATAAALITKAYRLAGQGELVEVACTGGTGRTGTVLACMAILAGYPAGDAITWVRRHYRPRAVETGGQRRWVGWFADQADLA